MTEPQRKLPKFDIDGVLLLDKACGVSSNQALQQVRRLYQAKKAGHTGVLDPLATGLLPVCFGQATKFAQYLLDADKSYIATLKLGEATTTGDAEGDIIQTAPVECPQSDFEKIIKNFIGTINQTPPMYSALKHLGKPLYEYARQGIEIERKSREIVIYDISLISFSCPHVQISVKCSKGTYIRTLAEDIAQAAGTVAHLTALSRTSTAGFSLSNALNYEELQAITAEERLHKLLPCDILVAHFPKVLLDDAQTKCLKQGQVVQTDIKHDKMEKFRVYSMKNEFVGMGEIDQDGLLKALRLINTASDETV
jgi:tRNA pseudouridine55 synthase